jgi:hypothetical protein
MQTGIIFFDAAFERSSVPQPSIHVEFFGAMGWLSFSELIHAANPSRNTLARRLLRQLRLPKLIPGTMKSVGRPNAV